MVGSTPAPGHLPWARRRAANLLNGSTLLGLRLAARHGVRVRPGPHGLWLAPGYPRRFPAPGAGAVCVGDVVLLRRGSATTAGVDAMDRTPQLFDHERHHATQWARWGPLFLPAYLLACGWSWLLTGDGHSANRFEVSAGLVDGGYRVSGPRPALLGLLSRSSRARARR